MNKFQYKIAQFMMGRRGFDRFCRGLLIATAILLLADIFVPKNVLSSIGTGLMVYSYYRAFSKNIAKRQAEENWYLAKIEMPLTSYMNRDRKNYKYFKCPTCGQSLRAPKSRGRIRVTCSRCRHVFERKV